MARKKAVERQIRYWIGEVVLEKLQQSAADRSNPHALYLHDTLTSLIVDGLSNEQLNLMKTVLSVDFISWKQSAKDLPASLSEEPDKPRPQSRVRGKFLTAASLMPSKNGGSDPRWNPQALDWPLRPKAHGEEVEWVRKLILEYLYAITWGQPTNTRVQLRKEIERAARRLYEVAVIVTTEYASVP
jgi:hypothetical protein